MAKIIKKLRRKTQEKKEQEGFLGKLKFTESYTSLILGAIVVLIAGILFVSFAKTHRNTQTSSVKDFLKITKQDLQNSNTSSTYTVRPGDDLWTISENIYSDGYKWVEIAKLNKIKNPGLIYAGNKLTIPTASPIMIQKKSVNEKIEQNQQAGNIAVKKNPITGNSYTVVKGDCLWNIAVRAYGDGFKWVEIAKANNLANPQIIHRGNVFKIPR